MYVVVVVSFSPAPTSIPTPSSYLASVLQHGVPELAAVPHLQVIPGHERQRLPLVAATRVVVGHGPEAVVRQLLLRLENGKNKGKRERERRVKKYIWKTACNFLLTLELSI